MKKIGLRRLIGLVFILLILFSNRSLAQNAIVGSGFTSGWATTGNFEYLTGSAGTSYIKTDVANGTGNQYFRMGVDWGGTTGQYTVTPGSDTPISPNAELQLNSGSTGSGAMYLNVTSTSHNYIFKTKDAGSIPTFKLIIFKVEGAVRSVSGVYKDLATVYRGQTVTVTVTLDGSLNAGQSVYLRYTKDNFTTSTIVEMTGSGTSYSAGIPSVTNTANATVKYYVFTSGNGLTITSDDADWYTINLNNNSGSNYSYIVNSSFISKASGLWSSSSTWAGDQIPSSGEAVIIDHNVTLDQSASISSLTINSGKTFTASDETAKTLTITKSTSGSSTTLSNSGTWAYGTGGSTVVFTGAPSSGDAVHAITGTIAFQNIIVNKTDGISNVGVSFGANSSVSGTLEIGIGGFVSTAPPTSFYGANAILKFNQGSGATYDVNSGDFSWSSTVIPNYITISSGTVNLNTERTASGNLIIDGGKLAIFSALTVSGTLTNSAGASGLVIESGASLVHNSDNVNATVKREIAKDSKWHFISSPNSGIIMPAICDENFAPLISNFNSTTGATYGFFKWSEATSVSGAVWNNLKNSDWSVNTSDFGNPPKFVKGTGYLVEYASDFSGSTTKSFVDSLANGSQIIPVSVSNNTFNLIGNPFASAIDWKASSGWDMTVLKTDGTNGGKNIWIWNGTSGNYGTYSTTTSGDVGTNSVGRYIAPTQGFFVQAATAGNLTLDNSVRVPNIASQLKSTEDQMNSIRLLVSGDSNSYSDEILIEFGHSTNDGGSGKWWSLYPEAPGLYTVKNEKNYSISFLTDITENQTIPVAFKAGVDGSYTLISTFDQSSFGSINLQDLKTGVIQDLKTNPLYSFTATTGDDASRFVLKFSSVGINDLQNAQSGIYTYGNKLCVENSGQATLEVYNMAGQRILVQDINNAGLYQTTLNNQTGYYVVRLTNAGQVKVSKVFIK